MENGNSEVTKSLGNETLPVKTDVRESEEENPQEGTENAGECHKDGDVNEMLALSDQTAGQDIKQDTEKVGEEQYDNSIHQEEGGMQNIETSGQEVKNNDEQIKVEKSPDQINSSDDQRSQEPNKVDSNEHPPKVEDKSADSPPEQEMDNALQLVSQYFLISVGLRKYFYRRLHLFFHESKVLVHVVNKGLYHLSRLRIYRCPLGVCQYETFFFHRHLEKPLFFLNLMHLTQWRMLQTSSNWNR